MQYIKTNGDDTYIEFDKEKLTSRVVVKSEVEKRLADAQTRLTAIPTEPTDEELLAWAREHYDGMDYSVEKQTLEEIINTSQAILEQLKNG